MKSWGQERQSVLDIEDNKCEEEKDAEEVACFNAPFSINPPINEILHLSEENILKCEVDAIAIPNNERLSERSYISKLNTVSSPSFVF